MGTALVLLLLCGAFALWDAPDRARRHSAERRQVLDALAALQPSTTAPSLVREIARRTGSRPSDRVVLGHLAALDEDGLVAISRRGSTPEPHYALLARDHADIAGTTEDKPAGLTVYHDGTCPLCAAEIAHYRRARGAHALRFADVSDPDARPGDDLAREVALARFHVRTGDGRLLAGAAAFAALWRTLPGWRWLGRIVGSRPILPLAEAAYRAFLPLRPYLARSLIALGALRAVRPRTTAASGTPDDR